MEPKGDKEPLNTGQRNRRSDRRRVLRKWVRRLLRTRSYLMVTFWVVKTIVKLVWLLMSDGS